LRTGGDDQVRTVVEWLDRYWCSGQAAERRAWKPYAAEVAAYTRPSSSTRFAAAVVAAMATPKDCLQ